MLRLCRTKDASKSLRCGRGRRASELDGNTCVAKTAGVDADFIPRQPKCFQLARDSGHATRRQGTVLRPRKGSGNRRDAHRPAPLVGRHNGGTQRLARIGVQQRRAIGKRHLTDQPRRVGGRTRSSGRCLCRQSRGGGGGGRDCGRNRRRHQNRRHERRQRCGLRCGRLDRGWCGCRKGRCGRRNNRCRRYEPSGRGPCRCSRDWCCPAWR